MNSYTWQLIIVGVIVAAAIIYAIVRGARSRKRGSGCNGCCGCNGCSGGPTCGQLKPPAGKKKPKI